VAYVNWNDSPFGRLTFDNRATVAVVAVPVTSTGFPITIPSPPVAFFWYSNV
jgi:hypothetical protein